MTKQEALETLISAAGSEARPEDAPLVTAVKVLVVHYATALDQLFEDIHTIARNTQ
jgi:hypothetical protein